MATTSKGEKLVQSESGDWYMIPADNVDVWNEVYSFADDQPAWAVYVQSPSFVTIYEWESSLQ